VTSSSGATSGERRLRRDAEENRRKILAAARDLFAEYGLEATLDDVARRAGVGVGTVYRKYPCREDFLDVLFTEAVDELADIALHAAEGRSAWDALVYFLERACARFAADRGLREIVLDACRGREGVECARHQLEPRIDQLVTAAKAEGRLRPDVDGSDLPQLLGMVVHTIDQAGDVRPDLWRRYLLLLLDGLLVERSSVSDLQEPHLTSDEVERIVADRQRNTESPQARHRRS
jgi:AcrR family transcriptional regulator